MKTGKRQIPVRGYLMHLTHYDPKWIGVKDKEAPFDLALGIELVDAMAAAGLNTLVVDIEDGVEYTSHPELKRHYTSPMDCLKQLVARVRRNGMEFIPKLNFSRSKRHGHSQWFRPHTELGDTAAYWRMAFELIDEIVAAAKPERFFFIGMDEDLDRTDRHYVEAIRTLRSGLRQRGLRAVMWNDTANLRPENFPCIRKTIAAESGIRKDVVQVVWDYDEPRRHVVDHLRELRERGFDVWIAPGLNAGQVDIWRRMAGEVDCNGLLMTMWRPVKASNRNSMLEAIRTIGPLYARNDWEGALPRISERCCVVKAPAPLALSAGRPAKVSVLAPNRLGRPRAKAPYLLPADVHLGSWMILGPFPFDPAGYKDSQQRDVIDDASFLGGNEAELVAKAEGVEEFGARWCRYRPSRSEEFPHVVYLSSLYHSMEHALAYLVAHVHSPRTASDFRLYLGSHDYIKVWLNAQVIHTFNAAPRLVAQDDDLITGVTLRKGWNTLLIKCVNIRSTWAWGLMARFADSLDRPLTTIMKI